MNIAIFYSGFQGTSFDAFLVQALLGEPEVSQVVLVIGVASSERGRRPRRRPLVDRLQFFVTRADQRTIRLATLAETGAQVVEPARHATFSDSLSRSRVDLVIDFTDEDISIAQMVPRKAPRLELWANGQRADLSFSIYRGRGRSTVGGQTVQVTIADERLTRRVVEESRLPSVSIYPAFDRRNAMARSVSLLVRAVRRVSSGEAPRGPCQPLEQHGGSGYVHALLSLAAVTANSARRFLGRRWIDDNRWFLAYRTERTKFVSQTQSPEAGDFRVLRPQRDRSYADPFLFSRDGRTFIFFEDYRNDLRRGLISCVQYYADGSLGKPFTVLAKPFHLSYPFVFEHEGEVYMIPESAENRTIDLYISRNFPHEWELYASLLQNVNGADPTLHFDGETWWMFVSIGEFGAVPWDELSLYYSKQLLGPWLPHPLNPVKRDASSSRPAGRLFFRRGKLIRPAQDCSRVYGGAVTLCEIVELTPHSFVERQVDTIPAIWLPGAKALHTLDTSDGIEVIDGRD